jgi:hypothetical protein
MLLGVPALARPEPAMVRVTVATTPPGARVTERGPDGRARTSRGSVLTLERTQSHILQVQMPGYQDAVVKVAPGQTRVDVRLAPSTLGTFLALYFYHWPVGWLPLLLMGGAAAAIWVRHRRRTRHLAEAVVVAELELPTPVGRTIGEYRVVEQIGRGGCAEVYRAEHVDFGDVVALKMLKADVADADALPRFYREMALGRDLQHRHLVRVFAFGDYRGMPYLVMELLRGRTLAARLAEGCLPLSEALHLFRQRAEGLAYAHRRGVVHRDVKPENVMLLEDGTLRILDFGLAKFLSTTRRLTRSSMTLGTQG